MHKENRVFVAGISGMVGSAVSRELVRQGFKDIVGAYNSKLPDKKVLSPFSEIEQQIKLIQLDLTNQSQVEEFFAVYKPKYVFFCAAKVGGILANSTYQAEFIYDNLQMACNVIHSAFRHEAEKLLNLGSSCIYPRLCPQPMQEEHLLSGPLEPTNEPYAIAKIGAIKLCRYYNQQYGTNFISVMPTNLYGPNDNFDLKTSHVLPALIRKFQEAKKGQKKEVEVWGSGSPKREFLHVQDLAQACLYLMQNYQAEEIGEFVNIGTGEDISIKNLAELIADLTEFKGKIAWDESKPDGTLRKLLDVSRIESLGWSAKIGLKEGLESTYAWFAENYA